MPELPEVETLKRDLKKVKGKKIKSVKVNWPKMVLPLTVKSFTQNLKGQKILNIKRRAKVLIFELSNERYLMVHLKMTGQLIFDPKKGKMVVGGHPQKGGTQDLPNKYTHVIINFTDGTTLYFNDLRKFGWMRLVNKDYVDELSNGLGVEPLTKSFTFDYFTNFVKRFPNRRVKQFLLDQTIIAGLGNIYVDESCYGAKIKPTRRVGSLTKKETKDLFKCIPEVLKLSIANKGTSFSNYIQLDGKEGRMIKFLKVYNKKGQKCQRCGAEIKKIKLNGRGTHFCAKCQK